MAFTDNKDSQKFSWKKTVIYKIYYTFLEINLVGPGKLTRSHIH